MSRSVVLQGALRCPACALPLRWCVCEAQQLVPCAPLIDVLQHRLEGHRPSSTGNLIPRVVAGARVHAYRREAPPRRADIVRPEAEELWILHPGGEPAPALPPGGAARLQVLLLDASWAQAGGMMAHVASWGRRVRLPMRGTSRYALRAQNAPDRFSTFEALLFVLHALGENATAERLRPHFELHVYAGLLSRGRKADAAAYLRASPLPALWPELLARLAPRREREGGGDDGGNDGDEREEASPATRPAAG
jgi:DTW domain-containing protein